MFKGGKKRPERGGILGLRRFPLPSFLFLLSGHIFSGESLLEQARRLMAPGGSSVSTGKP